jgi:cytochrome c oxidase assembly protein subunit 15
MGRLLVAFASVAILLGTVVTGAGPHAGSHEGQLVERLPFAVSDVARLHSISVLLFGGVLLFFLRGLRVTGGAPVLLRRAEVLLGVLVAQGIVGYAQYFLGVPPLLVALHIAGSSAVWIATLRLALAMHVRAPAAEPAVPEAAIR